MSRESIARDLDRLSLDAEHADDHHERQYVAQRLSELAREVRDLPEPHGCGDVCGDCDACR